MSSHDLQLAVSFAVVRCEEKNVKPIVLFVFPTLGISKRLRNYETHMWMGHVVQHATAIPVFIEANRVTFGEHKNISVEAWGGGKKYNKRT